MYLEKLKLDNRVAVVIGGGRGIGAAICEALCEAGATVVVADILGDNAIASANALKAKGYKAEPLTLDVTKSADVEAAATALAAKHGRIDVLVANAGICTVNLPAEETSDEIWRQHMDVNVDAVFWCCRAFGKQMLAAGKGSIVTIGSMSGDIVNRPQPQSYYNTGKAAVHHLTRSLAAEWAPRGVRVNSIAPTYIATPMTKRGITEHPDWHKVWLETTPMARMGEPEEIASVAHFLASDASSLMTGAIVAVDGGFTCW